MQRSAVLFAWLLMLSASLASAQVPRIPDRSYAADQVGRIISPPMERVHHNQPSVVQGALLLGGNGVHSFYDITEPTSPRHISTFESPYHSGEAESHQIAFLRDLDGSVYAAMISGRGIDVFDLTDITSPTLLDTVELEGVNYGDNTEAVWGVAWQGNTIYAGGTNTGLHVIDATDPRALSVVTRVPTSELGGVDAGPLFGLGNTLIVTTPKERAGIATVDLTDPRAPAMLDSVLPAVDSYIGGFFGRHAFLITPYRAYDVTTDPRNIELVAEVSVPPSEYVSFGDGHLFLGLLRPNAGAIKYDLADITAPRMVQRITGRLMDRPFGVLIDDQFTIPIGNLVVLSDDEINVGTVLAVHDERRDSRPPSVELVRPADGAAAQPLTTVIALSFSDQIELRSVTDESLVVRPVGGAPIRGRIGHQQTLITFAPEAPLAPDTTYEVVLAAGGITDLVGNALAAEHRSVFSTGADVRAPHCRIEPTLVSEVSAAAAFSAEDAGAGASYAWSIGASASPPSSMRTHSHTFASPGRHGVSLTVTTADGIRTCSAIQIVRPALPARAPTASSTVIVDRARGAAFVVNPDADTVTAVELATRTVRFEAAVGQHPRTVAQAPDGTLWVACEGSDEIVLLDPDTGARRGEIALRYGAAPYGIAFEPAGARAFVTLSGPGELVAIDASTRAVATPIALGSERAEVRHVALSPDGSRAYVARLVSPSARGQVFEVDTGAGAVRRTIELAEDPGPDGGSAGRGIPNYLGALAISPDGSRLHIPSKKDNTSRGLTRDGLALNTDNTVRTIVSQVDLASGAELMSARIDLDDHDMASAVVLNPNGDLVFITTQGTNRVDVYEAASGWLVGGFATGLAPQGLALDGDTLVVQSFMSRALDVYDVSGLLAGTDGAARALGSVRTVANETLSPEVLLGKQIFYNADDPRMSLDGYVACASCHLDGGSDQRVWDFTDRGEGLRNTTDLRGRAGMAHGPVHWTGNFDEIQDFENDIRLHFGGSGLMRDADFEARRDTLGMPKAGASESLDALAAYVASLDTFPRSPHRNPDGTMTTEARRGRGIFDRLGCASCHAGERFTDSASGVLHDVGTLRASSGMRLGQPLTGIDTPTLLGVWASAPYLHDGSAATLEDVLRSAQHGGTDALTEIERGELAAFLRELDGSPLGEPISPDGGMPDAGTAPSSSSSGGCAVRHGAPSHAIALLLTALALAIVRRRRR